MNSSGGFQSSDRGRGWKAAAKLLKKNNWEDSATSPKVWGFSF